MESASTVSLKPRNRLPRSHWDHWICFRSLNETAEFASAVTLRPQKPFFSNDYLEFLDDFESIFKTALAHESGPKGWIVWWKKLRSKILWHCPVKKCGNGTPSLYLVWIRSPGVHLNSVLLVPVLLFFYFGSVVEEFYSNPGPLVDKATWCPSLFNFVIIIFLELWRMSSTQTLDFLLRRSTGVHLYLIFVIAIYFYKCSLGVLLQPWTYCG
jgi:hypothetical protein